MLQIFNASAMNADDGVHGLGDFDRFIRHARYVERIQEVASKPGGFIFSDVVLQSLIQAPSESSHVPLAWHCDLVLGIQIPCWANSRLIGAQLS